jgi:membrane-bound lytic murein transglycosylase A
MAAPVATTASADYAGLPGWSDDDHVAAFETLIAGAGAVLARAETPAPLAAVYRAALGERPLITGRAAARAFFEARFVPRRMVHDGPPGLLTGYYEPIVDGATTPTDRYRVPLLRRPPDLENVVAESERGAKSAGLTHVRRRPDGTTEPYSTRQDIETGALDHLTRDGAPLAFVYVADPVDAFMLQVQGSGAIRLPDGTIRRVTYAGKNGHPYTSVGRVMIDAGLFTAEQLTWQTMVDWLKSHPVEARPILWRNQSYVFFEWLDAPAPVGVMDTQLAVGRSLAVDTAFHALGTPLYVVAPTMTHVAPTGFNRLMVAHDVGSAIKGPERGDIFFGTGAEALALAGITKHAGAFFVLVPREAG